MIKKIICKDANIAVTLNFNLKRVIKSDPSTSRLITFHCNNSSLCEKYNSEKCPHINDWKNYLNY